MRWTAFPCVVLSPSHQAPSLASHTLSTVGVSYEYQPVLEEHRNTDTLN